MEEALKSRGRNPVSEFFRWNNFSIMAGIPSAFDRDRLYTPTSENPLVYHLYGHVDIPQSMVLTERDYIDFIINVSKEEKLLPATIRKALAVTSLLFIGYSLEDLSSRITFQSIMGMIKSSFQLPSIMVCLPLPDVANSPLALRYLDQYSKDMFRFHVYWGQFSDFFSELRSRWENFRTTL